jgi:hypothetical protein
VVLEMAFCIRIICPVKRRSNCFLSLIRHSFKKEEKKTNKNPA